LGGRQSRTGDLGARHASGYPRGDTASGLLEFRDALGNIDRMPNGLYERDLLAWSLHQADLLRPLRRDERVNDVDWANVAEEIEDASLSKLHSVESVQVPLENPFILDHLLEHELNTLLKRLPPSA
jgi:hypothetical protein